MNEANEARSAPNQKSAITSFIMPDSMADIFGDDWKPPPQPEIKIQPEPKIETKQAVKEIKNKLEVQINDPEK